VENAGELSEDVGYIPLPDEMYTEQKKKFNAFVEAHK
jgi:phosphate transport system substrate-binding protein